MLKLEQTLTQVYKKVSNKLCMFTLTTDCFFSLFACQSTERKHCPFLLSRYICLFIQMNQDQKIRQIYNTITWEIAFQ